MDNNKIIIALVVILIVMLVAGIFILNPGHAKADSRVIVTSNSTLHDGDSFTIRLTDLNDTPIANQTVNITIVDPNGDENHQVVTTDANGEASLPLRLATTNYTVNVSFAGNDKFAPCNTTQKLEMKEKVVEENVNQQSTQSTQSSSSSNNLFYDAEINVYYDSNGVVVDPDGHHSQAVGSSYSDLRDARDRWERGEPVMV